MPDEDGPAVLRHHLIAIATSKYQYPPWQDRPLDGVADELATIRRWLGVDDPVGSGREVPRFTEWAPDLTKSPELRQIEAQVRDRLADRPLGHSDAAVVYVTGHGLVDDKRHWIVLQWTQEGKLALTALSTANLVEWLQSTEVRYMLIMLDLCYAGAVTRDRWIVPAEHKEHWIGLASADAGQPAKVGALTDAIKGYLSFLDSPAGASVGGRRVPYLNGASFVDGIQRRLPKQSLWLLFPWALNRKQHYCLPNPHYRRLPSDDVEEARRDLASHWSPSSRGVSDETDRGWLFTGRERLMRELIHATNAPPTRYVVTGGVGAGKSAILARLVTLSDLGFLEEWSAHVEDVDPDLLPPPRAVDVAVHASGLSPLALLDRICTLLGVPRGAPAGQSTHRQLVDDWHAWLAHNPDPVTIVIDALDEASDPRAAIDLLAELDLAKRRWIRLIVGVRSVRDDDSGTVEDPAGRTLVAYAVDTLRAVSIPVDEPPYWVDEDVVEYAYQVLSSTEGSPYAGADAAYAGADAASTRQVAAEIARRCGRSFLVAQLAARYLAGERAVVDPNDPAWHAVITRGVTGIFHKDLYRIADPADRRRVLDLFRALAFARGRGLPWGRIWPAVANAVADLPDADGYTDESIVWLLNDRISGYLIAERSEDTTVYRFFHDALRTSLREDFDELLVSPR